MGWEPLDQDQITAFDCVQATTSMLCDASTAGVKRPSQLALRKATGVAYPQGVSYLAAERAAKEVSNVDLAPRYGLTRGEVAQLAPAGRAFGISIDCSVTANTARRTGTFRGGHTVFTVDYSVWPGGDICHCEKHVSTRHSEFTVQDPGTYAAGFLQWSAELLFRAAEARTNGHGINVLVGLDAKGVWRLGLGRGYCRKAPSTKAPAVRKVENRPYNVVEIVKGEPWDRPGGGTSNAWYRTPHNDFIRGDRLGSVNVEAP